MITVVIVAVVLCTLLSIVAIVSVAAAIDDSEVHGGWLVGVMLLSFTTGAVLTCANYEYSAATKAAEDAAVVQALPKHAEKPEKP